MEVDMTGTQDLLFGLIFCAALTAVIVTIGVVLGRREAREMKTESEGLNQETLRKAS
jgi:hypothetical protein